MTICCSPRKRIAIKTFAEALHSCFKNGLDSTRDYRALAGFLIVAPLLYTAIEVVVRYITPCDMSIVFGVLVLFVSGLVACFTPCKSLIMNLSLDYHFMLCGILWIGNGLWTKVFSISTETLATLFVVLAAISHALISCGLDTR